MTRRSPTLISIPGGRSRKRSRRMPKPRLNATAGIWGLITLTFGLAYFAIEATTLIVIAAISAVVAIVSIFAPHQHTPKKKASGTSVRRASTEFGQKSPGNGRSGSSGKAAASGANARCPYCSAGRNCPGPGKCQCKGCKQAKRDEKDGAKQPLLTRSQLRSKKMVRGEKQHVRTVEKGRK